MLGRKPCKVENHSWRTACCEGKYRDESWRIRTWGREGIEGFQVVGE
jgi:hypothetical protein